jgi:hypothetical protein
MVLRPFVKCNVAAVCTEPRSHVFVQMSGAAGMSLRSCVCAAYPERCPVLAVS